MSWYHFGYARIVADDYSSSSLLRGHAYFTNTCLGGIATIRKSDTPYTQVTRFQIQVNSTQDSRLDVFCERSEFVSVHVSVRVLAIMSLLSYKINNKMIFLYL